jgi:hypothetical protein
MFSLGNDVIPINFTYKHLGVECDQHLSTMKSMKDACVKLRGTLLSICNSGLHPVSISPATLRKIYMTVVVPKALYGCENWTCYSNKDISNLELAHNFCVKFIQNFHKSISTKFALCMLNIPNILTMINYRKLQLFGQLCRLPSKYLAKQIFVNRLIRYVSVDRQKHGFIPDIYRLLQKYDLLYVIYTFIDTGVFPSKLKWKKILQMKVINESTKELFLET